MTTQNGEFNVRNYDDEQLRRRIKIRQKQIDELKQLLGISKQHELLTLANNLGCSDFAEKLISWTEK